MIATEKRIYPNTFCLLPLFLMPLQMGHELFIRKDNHGQPVGHQDDLDNLRPYDPATGESTGAFISIAEFIAAHTNPNGTCSFVIDKNTGFNCDTHFIFKFGLSPARHPLLKKSDFDRMYDMAERDDLGMVELQDFSAALVGNEFKFMPNDLFHQFQSQSPHFISAETEV